MNAIFVWLRLFVFVSLGIYAQVLQAQDDLPWHLGSVDPIASAPSAINTVSVKPGSHEVVVAVIDSGVLSNHPSLKGRILPGFDMISKPT
jgi:subtilisin family serine protease